MTKVPESAWRSSLPENQTTAQWVVMVQPGRAMRRKLAASGKRKRVAEWAVKLGPKR